MSPTLDPIDTIATKAFDGYVVRKDLVRQFSRQFPVPTYVVEFMLGRYCATTTRRKSQEGLAIVQRQLSERTVRAGNEELVKSVAKEKGQVKDHRHHLGAARCRTDSYVAELPSLKLRDVRITAELVTEHQRMLTGGFYAEVTLGYDADDRPGEERPAVRHRRPARDPALPARRAGTIGRRHGPNSHGRVEGLPATLHRHGTGQLTERNKDAMLLRMVPFVERNYNLVEIGPRGTGKSHLFQQVSPYAHLVSGGKATVARMFVNNANGQRGLVCQYDVVCFDEGLRHFLRPEGWREHHEGLHGVRRVLARQGEHPRRRLDRHGRQLRCGCRTSAAHRPPVSAHAARDARRHRVHGPHPLLPAGLGRAEAQAGSSPTTSAWSATSSPNASPVAQPEPTGVLQNRIFFGGALVRARHQRGQQDDQRAVETDLYPGQERPSATRTGVGRAPGAGSAAGASRSSKSASAPPSSATRISATRWARKAWKSSSPLPSCRAREASATSRWSRDRSGSLHPVVTKIQACFQVWKSLKGPAAGCAMLNKPAPPPFQESIRCAEQNLYARAMQLVGDREPRQHEFSVQLRAFDSAKSGHRSCRRASRVVSLSPAV
jgi:ATP-dependent Lon protease